MRLLKGPYAVDGDVTDEQLADLYAPPGGSTPWLRVNMVSTLDGAGTGPDGRSGSINNEPDHRVFDVLRSLADAVVVGAGTVRAERYPPLGLPLVVVSARGQLPPSLHDAPTGSVLLATTSDAEHLGASTELLGPDHVLTLGESSVDLAALKHALADRGFRRLLGEGGPSLLRDMLAADVVDELCLTFVPRAVGGQHPRILAGGHVEAHFDLAVLLEEDGTLLARWMVRR